MYGQIREKEMQRPRVLAVDDEDVCLSLLEEMLQDGGFEVITAVNGQDALEKLEQYPDIQAIALDRMMPVMNGIECTNRLKADERFREIPIIMQTAAASGDEVREGTDAGVYYYLTKPYDKLTLCGIVRTAILDKNVQDNLRDLAREESEPRPVTEGVYAFRTLDEAHELACTFARALPNSDQIILGLTELMINAVEHGNLEISYDEKKQLLTQGIWEQEIRRRGILPKYRNREARLEYRLDQGCAVLTISDDGAGFNWRSFIEFDPSRATDPNGRGIFMVRSISTMNMRYNEVGNTVTCRIAL